MLAQRIKPIQVSNKTPFSNTIIKPSLQMDRLHPYTSRLTPSQWSSTISSQFLVHVVADPCKTNLIHDSIQNDHRPCLTHTHTLPFPMVLYNTVTVVYLYQRSLHMFLFFFVCVTFCYCYYYDDDFHKTRKAVIFSLFSISASPASPRLMILAENKTMGAS